jgi:hypothetical protein
MNKIEKLSEVLMNTSIKKIDAILNIHLSHDKAILLVSPKVYEEIDNQVNNKEQKGDNMKKSTAKKTTKKTATKKKTK